MDNTYKILLLIEPSRVWCQRFLAGIARYSQTHGPWGACRISEYYGNPVNTVDSRRKKATLSLIESWKPDAVITRETICIDELLAMKIPVIRADDNLPTRDIPHVVSNWQATGEMGAKYLMNRGLKHFAYCGFNDTTWSKKRLEYYRAQLARNGFEVDVYEQPLKGFRRLWANEPNRIADWLKSLPKPVGVMTCSDDRSLHVVEACRIAGLDIPDDISILGVDNDWLICDLSNPPLSSIALNTDKAGYEAAELLDKLLNGEKVSEQTIIIQPTNIVTRQSTDILAIDDKDVTEAIRYMQKNSGRMIQVNEVANAVALSRRRLEQRFRSVFNRSVHDEIRRIHVQHVIRMLVGTSLSITQIAAAMGHPTVGNLARYFQKETNMTPSNYRKLYCNK